MFSLYIFFKFIVSFVCAGSYCLARFSLVVENRCSVLASLWGGLFLPQSTGSRELRLKLQHTPQAREQ